MKKRLLIGIGLLIAFLLLGVWRLTARRSAQELVLPPIEPDGQRDFLQADLRYDEGTRTLRGTQTITATNRTDDALSEMVLRLYPDGGNDDNVAVTGIKANGLSVRSERDEEDDSLLRIALDWQPGQTMEISFSLMLKHSKAEGASIITLPSPAKSDGSIWPAFDYAVTLNERNQERTIQMQHARDASFVIFSGGKTKQKQIDGVLVTALAQSAAQAGKLLDYAKTAMESLAGIGLSYPFARLTVVQMDTDKEDGEAFSGLIVLGTEGEKETLIRRMTRLIARQTFGISVGCDMRTEPWLSHTLASTAELLAYRWRKGESAYETRFFEEIEVSSRLTRPYGVTIGAGVEHFGSDAEMTQVLRDQGAAMMLGIGEAAGYDALTQALVSYAQENADAFADRQALEAALERATGADWSGYLEDELNY